MEPTTAFVIALPNGCPDCGATTAYRYPTELACVRCGTDRTPPTGTWTPGLDKNSTYRRIALTGRR